MRVGVICLDGEKAGLEHCVLQGKGNTYQRLVKKRSKLRLLIRIEYSQPAAFTLSVSFTHN